MRTENKLAGNGLFFVEMFYHKFSFKVDHGREKYEKIKVCLQFLNFFFEN